MLELVGLDAPAVIDGVEQKPIEGTSFAYSFGDADAPDRHTTAVLRDVRLPSALPGRVLAVAFHDIQADEPGLDNVTWELYDVRTDLSECHDSPRRTLIGWRRWSSGGGRRPSPTRSSRWTTDCSRTSCSTDRPMCRGARYEYWPGGAPVPESRRRTCVTAPTT